MLHEFWITTVEELLALRAALWCYWWPESQGTGARGAKGGYGGLGRGDDFAPAAATQAGDIKEYRRLRGKQMSGKNG